MSGDLWHDGWRCHACVRAQLPNIISFASLWLAAETADRLIRRGTAVSTVRKGMSIVAGVIPAVCVVGLIYSNKATTTLLLFNLALFFQGFYCAGADRPALHHTLRRCSGAWFTSNFVLRRIIPHGTGGALTLLDLYPDHAGTIMGIDNAINNVPGFLAPMVAGIMLDRGHCPTDSSTAAKWRPSTPECDAAWAQLWWLSAGLYALGTAAYCMSLIGHSYAAHSDIDKGGTEQLSVPSDGLEIQGRRRVKAPAAGARLCDKLLFSYAFRTASS